MTDVWIIDDCRTAIAIFLTEDEARQAAEDYTSDQIDKGSYGWRTDIKEFRWTEKEEASLWTLSPSGWRETGLSLIKYTLGQVPGWRADIHDVSSRTS